MNLTKQPTKIIIESKNPKIIALANMLVVKQTFNDLGFKTIPKDLIIEFYHKLKMKNKLKLDVIDFYRKTDNAWKIRSYDMDIVKFYQDILSNIKGE